MINLILCLTVNIWKYQLCVTIANETKEIKCVNFPQPFICLLACPPSPSSSHNTTMAHKSRQHFIAWSTPIDPLDLGALIETNVSTRDSQSTLIQLATEQSSYVSKLSPELVECILIEVWREQYDVRSAVWKQRQDCYEENCGHILIHEDDLDDHCRKHDARVGLPYMRNVRFIGDIKKFVAAIKVN